MKSSGKFDLLIIAAAVALAAITSLFVLHARSHEKSHDAPPAIDMPAVKVYLPPKPATTLVATDPVKTDGAKTDIVKTDAVKTQPAKVDPPKTNPPGQPPLAVPATSSNSNTLELALLTAEWCGPCRDYKADALTALRPYFAAKNLLLREVDIDKHPQEAAELFAGGDKRVPQLVLYEADPDCDSASDDGEPGACSAVKPVRRLVGKQNVQAIKDFLENTRLEGEPVKPKPEIRAQKSEPADRPIRRLFHRR